MTSRCLSLNSVKKLLTDGLNKNQYLKRLELQQIKDMVECMYERTYLQGEFVVKQGEPGNHLFVLAGRSPMVTSSLFTNSPPFRFHCGCEVFRQIKSLKKFYVAEVFSHMGEVKHAGVSTKR